MEKENTKDTPTLGDVARLIANHDRRFHDQIERLLDGMGVPKHETNNTVELWGK